MLVAIAVRLVPEAALPSIYDLKPAFQDLLRPLVRACVRAGITPNHLTLAACLGSIAVGAVWAWAGWRTFGLLLVPAWLLVRMALNAMDGMAARECGLQSSLGAVLNELGDVVADLALYLPMATLAPALRWPAIAFALGAVLTEFSGVLAQALGGRRRYEGPMGKSDRAALVGLLALATAIAPALRRWWPVGLGIATTLAVVTCVNRLSMARPVAAGTPPRAGEDS